MLSHRGPRSSGLCPSRGVGGRGLPPPGLWGRTEGACLPPALSPLLSKPPACWAWWPHHVTRQAVPRVASPVPSCHTTVPTGSLGSFRWDPACCSPSAVPCPGLGPPPEGAGRSSQQGITSLPSCPHCPPWDHTPRWAQATWLILSPCWGRLLVTRDQAAGWAGPVPGFRTGSRFQGQGHTPRVLSGCAVRTWTRCDLCLRDEGSVTGYSRFFIGTLCLQPIGEGDRAGSSKPQALAGPDHLPGDRLGVWEKLPEHRGWGGMSLQAGAADGQGHGP